MIKVYFDWNVISQMKNGNHVELNNIVFDNTKLLKPYSTSHIGDIFSSFNETKEHAELISSDLEFISLLTDNLCLFNDGKKIILDYYPPKELFEQKVEEKDLFKDISVDGLSKIFESNEITKELGVVFSTLLKSIPLEEQFKKAFDNPQNAEQMEMLFPGLKDNPTMEGFFKSFSEMNKSLNEDGKYKDLRKIVQLGLGINRNKIFDNRHPFQLIDEIYQKVGFVNKEYLPNSKNAPEWFTKISNEYILLDMHGYQEDNVNVKKGRKETFKNTTEDAFHAAFASSCNFFVINDKKSYKKTKQVYEKLQINTLILKPEEFVEHYNNYLNFTDNSHSLNIISNLLKSGEFVEVQLEGAILRTYYFPFFIFDFFNKLMFLLPESEETRTLLLSQDGPTNSFTHSMEIKRLVIKISELFGKDLDELGEIQENELKQETWVGRKWKYGEIAFRLVRINGHFQLYLE